MEKKFDKPTSLDKARRDIDRIDNQLMHLLEQRRAVIKEIAKLKKSKGLPVENQKREEDILSKVSIYDAATFRAIIDSSKELQDQIIRTGSFALLTDKKTDNLPTRVHSYWGDYDYSILEASEDRIKEYLNSLVYQGFNVSGKYKKLAYDWCDQLAPECYALGNVNTLKREVDGTLTGYNTDYFGFHYMLEHFKIDVAGKKVVILGTGPMSDTVSAVVTDMGAANVYKISRTSENNYGNIERHEDAEILVNTTPVGAYPNNGESPVDISRFKKLSAVCDLIYNPYRTKLIMDAEDRGIKTATGLEMFIAQCGKTASILCKGHISVDDIERTIDKVLSVLLNRVLIGMAGAGKSFLGRRIAREHKMPFMDTDYIFTLDQGKTPEEFIREHGESRFRVMENLLLKELSKEMGMVISTGGGIVEEEKNRQLLRQNGIVIWVKRDLGKIQVADRPIYVRDGIKGVYERRKNLYESWSNMQLENKMDLKKNVLVISGPNMNLMEISIEDDRTLTYEDMVKEVSEEGRNRNINVSFMQSNHEGEIVEAIQQAKGAYDAIIMNPTGFGHSSLAIADAISIVGLPAVEVHIAQAETRAEYGPKTIMADNMTKVIKGSVFNAYIEALDFIKDI